MMSSSCWMDDELLIVRLLNGVLSFHVICSCKLVLVCPERLGIILSEPSAVGNSRRAPRDVSSVF